MIKIVFYGGTHGNYVEFVLNKLIYGDQIQLTNPLGIAGTSHRQRTDENYQKHKHFKCVSVNDFRQHNFKEAFIKIDFTTEEDITVLQLNLKRGEDYNIDPDTIHQDTYHKLLNKVNLSDPDGNGIYKIIDRINQYTDISFYYDIKDADWPNIQHIGEFKLLPADILQECSRRGFNPVELIGEHSPDAPKWVLRNMFKFWFYDKDSLPSAQMKLCDSFPNVYKLNLRNLYSVDKFQQELKNIGDYFDLDWNVDKFDTQVHQQFIDMVPYRQSSQRLASIIDAVKTGKNIDINLNLVEQACLDCEFEQQWGIEMPIEKEEYWSNTQELKSYIDQVHDNN